MVSCIDISFKPSWKTHPVKSLSVSISISLYGYCYLRSFRLCCSRLHLSCNFQVFQLLWKGWDLLFDAARHGPKYSPCAFSSWEHKSLSPSTPVCAPLLRNAQSFKSWLQLPQVARPTSYNAMQGSKNGGKILIVTNPVCRQPGSLHTSHECPCRPLWQGKDPLSDILSSISPGCQGASPCMQHLPCLTHCWGIKWFLYLQKGWQERDP